MILGGVGCLVCGLWLWLVFWLVSFGGVLLRGFRRCGLFGLWFVALVGVLVGLVWWGFCCVILGGVGCLTGWPYESASPNEVRKTGAFLSSLF